MKTSAQARIRNRSVRTRLRTAIKSVRQATTADTGQAKLREAISLLDRAATKRLLHPKTVARIKSGLTRHVTKLGA